jgi:hypothetical protein
LDGQHSGDEVEVLGVAVGGVGEQGVDRCEPGITGPGGVASLGLQMLQESGDGFDIEVGDLNVGRSGAGRVVQVGEQQALSS